MEPQHQMYWCRLDGLPVQGKMSWSAQLGPVGLSTPEHWNGLARFFLDRFFPAGSPHFTPVTRVQISLDRVNVLTTVSVERAAPEVA